MPRFDIKYSAHAEKLIAELKEFDKKAFETWYQNNVPIGDAAVREYLLFGKQK